MVHYNKFTLKKVEYKLNISICITQKMYYNINIWYGGANLINIYCDESCHLPNDDSDVMVLGALACPEEKKEEVNNKIREIKERYGINSKIELKWTKVSKEKIQMYEELIEYFFNNNDLTFRAIVAKNKCLLNHEIYNDNDPDLWYYKMYYLLLDKMCYYDRQYRIFIDIKDSHGGPRVKTLKDVLCNNKYDFMGEIIQSIEQVNSNRVDLLQVADILIGAIGFYHRGLFGKAESSIYKNRLVEKILANIGIQNLKNGTSRGESKMNIFIWTPNYRR